MFTFFNRTIRDSLQIGAGSEDVTVSGEVFEQDSKDIGVIIENCSGTISFDGCTFRGYDDRAISATGNTGELIFNNCFYEDCVGGAIVSGATPSKVHFTNNRAKDMRFSDPQEHWFQAISLGEVADFIVSHNRIQFWTGSYNDIFNFFNSGGTSANHAQIGYNKFKGVVLSEESGVISENVGGLPENRGGACIVVGDDGVGKVDVHDNQISNCCGFGIQAVTENGASEMNLFRNRVYIQQRNEFVFGLESQSALGLQLSSGVANLIDNIVYCIRWDGVANHTFGTIGGTSSGNLTGQDALDAGLASILQGNILV